MRQAAYAVVGLLAACGPRGKAASPAPVTAPVEEKRGPSEAQLRAACDAGLFDACDAIPLEVMPDELTLPEDLVLGEAVGRGDLPQVEALLRKGHDPNATDHDTVLLHTALARKYWRVAERLLAAGANPNVLAGGVSMYRNDPALIVAIKNRGDSVVGRLLSSGARIDLSGARGSTALHEALRTKSKPTVKLLLGRGASVRYRAYDGRSALDIAAAIDDPEFLTWVLSRLGDEDPPPSLEPISPPLMAAAHGCHVDNVNLLLERGALVDERHPETKETALIRAAMHGCNDVVERLLKEPNIGVDIADVEGETALIRSAGNGRLKIVRMLLAAGADPAIENREGNNALAQARVQGATATARLLEGRGAAMNPDAEARVSGEVAERWRNARLSRCRGQSDVNGKRTKFELCVRAEPGDRGPRYLAVLSDTSRLGKDRQHVVVAQTELTVGDGEQIDVDASWNGTLKSGHYFLFVPIVTGNPDEATSRRGEIYIGATIRSRPRRVWRSPSCRGCKAQDFQTRTHPKEGTSFLYITTDRSGTRRTTTMDVRNGRIAQARAR
ncbi:MAG: ankyrin repeat domain-containing protein [Myxococcota bacterium]